MGMFTDYVRGLVASVLGPVVDERAQELADRRAHYEGRQYDGKGLRPPWTKVPQGQNPGPLRTQKPAMQYDIAKLVVDRPTSLLAGEGRFPRFGYRPAAKDTDVTAVEEWLNAAAEEGELAHAGLLAARWSGAEGSAAVVWDLVHGELRYRPLLGEQCTPTFDPQDPHVVASLARQYPFEQKDAATGKAVTYWYRETWDATAHTVYAPAKAKPDGTAPDAWTVAASAEHKLGFCPAGWLRLVDDPSGGDSPDGLPLHHGIDDLTADIDRVLGQMARAILLNQDPRSVWFGATEEDLAALKRGAADVLLPSTERGGDVKLVEMSGEGQRVAAEHIGAQRDRALETTRVVLPNSDRLLAAARSGAALRVLHAVMLELVGELRTPFGRLLRQLLQQLVRAAQAGALGMTATPPPASIPPGRVTVAWGDYFDPTPDDLLTAAQTAESLGRAGLDDETVVTWLAARFGWKNTHDVLERVQEGRGERAAQLEAATKSLTAQKSGDEGEPDGDEGAVGAATPAAVAPGAAGAPAPADTADVQDTALNGAQVASLLDVVKEAASGELPAESVAAILEAAFPTLKPGLVKRMLDPLKDHKPPPKPAPPAPPPGGAPPQPPPVPPKPAGEGDAPAGA